MYHYSNMTQINRCSWLMAVASNQVIGMKQQCMYCSTFVQILVHVCKSWSTTKAIAFAIHMYISKQLEQITIGRQMGEV